MTTSFRTAIVEALGGMMPQPKPRALVTPVSPQQTLGLELGKLGQRVAGHSAHAATYPVGLTAYREKMLPALDEDLPPLLRGLTDHSLWRESVPFAARVHYADRIDTLSAEIRKRLDGDVDEAGMLGAAVYTTPNGVVTSVASDLPRQGLDLGSALLGASHLILGG